MRLKNLSQILIIMGMLLAIASCTFPKPSPPDQKKVPIPPTGDVPDASPDGDVQDTSADSEVSGMNPNLSNEQIGLLFPFSKLVSGPLKTKMGQYYDGFETELVSALQKQGVVVTQIQYPPNQQPFTYDEMNAPTFSIDPDDFTSPTQVLKTISSPGFSKIIFGHVEEISGSLYLVARIYSIANNKISSALTQKINTATLTSAKVNTKLNQLATEIAELVPIGSRQSSQSSKKPEGGSENNSLFGFDNKID